MLVDLTNVLSDAPLARMAFNITSVEGFEVLQETAESLDVPLILQISERYLKDLGPAFIRDVAVPRLDRSPQRFVLHLDHAGSVESVMAGLRLGFSSVMYDGSTLDLATNIRHSQEVLRLARLAKVSVEAEIGHVGRAEDGEADTAELLTTPGEAEVFMDAVPVDALAVAVGNAHGLYTQPPHLQIERVAAIYQRIGVPLVLHGGTGIPMDDMLAAAQAGMKKINVGTELKQAWIAGAKSGTARFAELDQIRDVIKQAIRTAVLQFQPLLTGPA